MPSDATGLQPPLRTPEFEALFELLKTGTVHQDLSVLLVYYIDIVNVSVLPHLAEQFDVLGYKGWLLADTEAKKRALLKEAIQLHQKAGTPFAILRSLAAVGFGGATIDDNPALLADGSIVADGSEIAAGKLWARFRVNFASPLPPDKVDLVQNLIEVWKPARSHLLWTPGLLVADGYADAAGDEVADGYK